MCSCTAEEQRCLPDSAFFDIISLQAVRYTDVVHNMILFIPQSKECMLSGMHH